ncbi:MAG: tetratricopeptide repeat protein [Alphaproteobacteria bacterium]|nr:tetratricopeptide repeat protein [Alphaproteobacteria bacterium]
MSPEAALREARSLRRRARYAEALAVVDAVSADDSEAGARLGVERADLIRLLGRADEADAALSELARTAAERGWGVARMEALRLRLSCAIALRRAAGAEAMGLEALRLAQARGDAELEARITCELARLAWVGGDLKLATSRMNEAIDLAATARLEEVQADALTELAHLRLAAGEPAVAAAVARRAVALATRGGAGTSAGRAWQALGLTLNASGQRADAEEAHREALAIFESLDHAPGQAWALDSLGELARHQGALEDAADLHSRAAALLRPHGRGADHLTRLNLALVRVAQGRFEDAAALLDALEAESRDAATRLRLRVARLPVAVGLGDHARWQSDAEAVRGAVASLPAEPDTAWLLERAGALAGGRSPARWQEPATVAWSLALEQWSALGQQPAVARCRAALAALGAAGAPIRLGAFTLQDVLGRGGMGQVWRGAHRSGAPVAVKVLSAEVLHGPEARRALTAEVRAVAALHHPHIIALFDHGDVSLAAEALSGGRLQAGSPYLVMELGHGGSLEPLCGRLPWDRCRTLLLELLDALAHAHARSLLHQDLKPDNVLLEDPRDLRAGLKLTDFGLARAIGGGPRRRIVGTPAYMAPEQLREAWRDLGPWTDLYAVGCLATALVTGHPPFERDDVQELVRAHQMEPPPPLVPRVPVPVGFDAWRRRLLEKSPRARFLRAADAAHALRTLPEAPLLPAGAAVAPPLPPPTAGAATFFLDLEPEASPAPSPAAEAYPLPPIPADWRRPDPGETPRALADAGLKLFGLRRLALVGRERERDRLWAALRDDRARVVVIRGPIGVGKSRLGEWLMRRAHETGAAFTAQLHADPTTGGRLPRTQFRWSGLQGADLVEAAAVELQAIGEDDPFMAQAFAELIEPGSAGLAFPSPRHRLFAGLTALLRYTRGRKLAVFVDDVHRDPDIIGIAENLLAALSDLPVLLVLAARDGDTAADPQALDRLLALEGAEALRLGPLPVDALMGLLMDALRLQESLARRVARRSGGSPRFALELVGDWVERGLLVSAEGGFALRPGASPSLPDSLHQVWSARVDRLLGPQAEDDRKALALAAQLGEEVSAVEWSTACAALGLTPPHDRVQTFISNGLVQPRDDGWRFSVEVLRESLLRDARERGWETALHAACAEALAGEGGARLGLHRLAAGRAVEAIAPMIEGMRRHLDQAEFAEVVALGARVEQALTTAGAPLDDPRRFRAGLFSARALNSMGRGAELAQRVRGLLDAGPPPAERAALLRLLGSAFLTVGELERATETFEEAVEGFASLDDVDGEGVALYGLASALRARGELAAALPMLLRARRLLDQTGNLRRATAARIALGNLYAILGEPEEAERLLTEALELARQTGSDTARIATLNGLAELDRRAGRLRSAQVRYEEVARAALASGSNLRPIAQLNLAQVLIARQRWREARTLLREVRETLARDRRGGLEAVAWALLATPELEVGERGAAQAALERAGALVAETGFAEPDLVEAFERAAEVAARDGAHAIAAAARALARDQSARLGRSP